MYSSVPDQESAFGGKADYAAQFAEQRVRSGFVRKVFGILAVQIFLTAAICASFVLIRPAQLFVAHHVWTLYVAMGLTLVISLTLACCQGARHTFPANYILLLAFTLCEGFLVGVISAQYNIQEVFLALGLTTLITVGLSLFACQTKVDFTMMGGFLLGALLTFVGASFIMMFFPATKVSTIVISSFGALLFSLFLMYDIQLVLGGRRDEIGPDEYVLAALNIYLDIINLFLYLLQLISALSGNRN